MATQKSLNVRKFILIQYKLVYRGETVSITLKLKIRVIRELEDYNIFHSFAWNIQLVLDHLQIQKLLKSEIVGRYIPVFVTAKTSTHIFFFPLV